MKTKNLVIIVVAVLLVVIGGAFVLAANSGNSEKMSSDESSSSTSKSDDSAASTSNSNNNAVSAATVNIKDYAFGPMQTKIKVGETVTFTNMDDVHHNVIADKESADAPNGPLLAKGESYKFTFTKAGSFAYHCGPHPYMHGTVVVE